MQRPKSPLRIFIGQYNADGTLINEIVYLNDIPVIVITPTGNYFIHSDQLNTPREITNASGTIVWKWENTDPFGANAANDDPDGDGTKFEFNHRFAGQYFDQETGLHQNYYRDYDPALGRYRQSDPIGLKGGLNTYGYVGANPLSTIDPLGLKGCRWAGPVLICDIPLPPPPPMNPSDDPFINPNSPGYEPPELHWPRSPSGDPALNPMDALFPIIYQAIKEICDGDTEDDNCEELYKSTLRTCASLSGRKQFKCFEAARINREQCYQERDKK